MLAPDTNNRFGLGNIDLFNRPNVPTPGHPGMYSSVRSASFTDDKGRVILLPTVIRHNGRWIVGSQQQAWANYQRTGQHLGIFKTVADAERYSQALHEQQAALGTNQAKALLQLARSQQRRP